MFTFLGELEYEGILNKDFEETIVFGFPSFFADTVIYFLGFVFKGVTEILKLLELSLAFLSIISKS